MEKSLKKQKSMDMTIGSPIKVILLFTLPLIAGNLFQQLYNIIDSIVVGNYLGTEALAAVSSSGSLINLLIGLIQGISVGGGIVVAQYYGAGNKKRLSDSIHTLVLFGIVLALVMTVVGYILSPYLLILMNTDSDVLPLSTEYFRIYFLGVIFTIMYNNGSAIFRAVGDSRHPLYYLIYASILNVILDLLFVAVFHMGVRGVAIATLCSQALSCFLTFFKLMREKTDYQVSFKKLKFHRSEIGRILAYGIPSGLQNSIISLSNVFIQSNINMFGKIAQAGCGSYSKIEGFATLPSGSFSMALSTYVGQNIGAKKYDRVKKGALQGLVVDLIVTEVIGIILYIFAPSLLSMFTSSPDVISIGIREARIIVMFYFLLAFSHGMSGILRGAGMSKTPMFTMISCWVLIRIIFIPVVMNLTNYSNIEYIFWFYPFTWGLSFIILIIVSLIKKWWEPKIKGINN